MNSDSLAVYPLLWHVNYGQTKLRPVHSFDVAQALDIMSDAEATTLGQTFSLGGPNTYKINDILKIVESLTFNKTLRPGVNIPKAVLKAATKAGSLVWWPMLSPDELERRYLDDRADEPGTLGFSDLGIEPDTLEERAIVYLRRYRSNLRFEQPVVSGPLLTRTSNLTSMLCLPCRKGLGLN